jgi:MurNAc alpha-1-phosphate uridylyltransferase
MRVMILAAGMGERMRPLTDTTPKPLLEVNNKPLIQHQVERLVSEGLTEMVINHGLMGEKIESFLGDGQQLGASIQYSAEHNNLLETGGGIYKALPLLGDEPFVVVNADVWTDYPFSQLPNEPAGLAHLVLIDNPPQHPQGDFALQDGQVTQEDKTRYTFSGIGVYRSELFIHCDNGPFSLTPLLREAMAQGKVTGEHYAGLWIDVGTPERLQCLQTDYS